MKTYEQKPSKRWGFARERGKSDTYKQLSAARLERGPFPTMVW